jgi:hypothetical protein
VTGSCEHGNGPSGSIKVGEFLDWLSDCQLLKKDSAAWSLCIRCLRDAFIAHTVLITQQILHATETVSLPFFKHLPHSEILKIGSIFCTVWSCLYVEPSLNKIDLFYSSLM